MKFHSYLKQEIIDLATKSNFKFEYPSENEIVIIHAKEHHTFKITRVKIEEMYGKNFTQSQFLKYLFSAFKICFPFGSDLIEVDYRKQEQEKFEKQVDDFYY